jgi:protein-S-isoprenylcysteine O-methyltransferase Ste14
MPSGAALLIAWVQPAIWLLWLLYWKISAAGVKVTVRQESAAQRISHFGPLWAAALLFCFPNRLPFLRHHLFPPSYMAFAIGTLVLILGLLFSVWARVALGLNWSATVAVKKDHELVEAGPYRWVRHPIYTGILTGFIGTAIAQDRWSSVLAVILVFVGFWFKLLREEAWMRETFGDRYSLYCERTKRLIPFIL